jgi:chromosome segregation ATPase
MASPPKRRSESDGHQDNTRKRTAVEVIDLVDDDDADHREQSKILGGATTDVNIKSNIDDVDDDEDDERTETDDFQANAGDDAAGGEASRSTWLLSTLIDMQHNFNEVSRQLASKEGQLRDINSRFAKAMGQMSRLQRELNDAKADLNDAKAELKKSDIIVGALETRLDASKARLRTTEDELRRVSDELRRVSDELRRVSDELRRVNGELRKAKDDSTYDATIERDVDHVLSMVRATMHAPETHQDALRLLGQVAGNPLALSAIILQFEDVVVPAIKSDKPTRHKVLLIIHPDKTSACGQTTRILASRAARLITGSN